MNSLDKLLTNTTNRFQSPNPLFSPLSQSNFTPLSSSITPIIPFPSKKLQYLPQSDIQPVQQSYQFFQQKYNQLTKTLQQAKNERNFMKVLFDKIFMVEEGKHQHMKKRFRRKKNQIQNKFSCESCFKIYSSSTSLARHEKLKHSNCTFEPPQVKYEIPPEPNSMNLPFGEEESWQNELKDRKIGEKNLTKPNLMNEQSFQNSQHKNSDIENDNQSSQE